MIRPPVSRSSIIIIIHWLGLLFLAGEAPVVVPAPDTTVAPQQQH
jgi:hypothetical protein